jgi:hypothetical protein
MRDVGDVMQPDALVRAPRAVWVVADLAAASDHLDAHEAEEDAENSAERGVCEDFGHAFVVSFGRAVVSHAGSPVGRQIEKSRVFVSCCFVSGSRSG